MIRKILEERKNVFAVKQIALNLLSVLFRKHYQSKLHSNARELWRDSSQVASEINFCVDGKLSELFPEIITNGYSVIMYTSLSR